MIAMARNAHRMGMGRDVDAASDIPDAGDIDRVLGVSTGDEEVAEATDETADGGTDDASDFDVTLGDGSQGTEGGALDGNGDAREGGDMGVTKAADSGMSQTTDLGVADGAGDSGGDADAGVSQGLDAGASEGDGDSGGLGDAGSCGLGGCVDAGCILCACDASVLGAPEQVTGFGLTADLYAPTLTPDGHTIYFGVFANAQEQLYVATRPDDGPVFSQAVPVSSVNSTSSDGTPFLSQDGLTLYFYSTRPGGRGSRDIWTAQRPSLQLDFAPPVVLAAVNSPSFDSAPWVSADQLTMTFVSTRQPNVGGADIYMATRSSTDDPFSQPALLGGTAVNSMSNEDRGAMTRDGLKIYFGSDRGNTNGVYDLWMATRANVASDFSNAGKVQVLDSAGSNINAVLTVDERELYFSSSRTGSQQIWRSVLQCP